MTRLKGLESLFWIETRGHHSGTRPAIGGDCPQLRRAVVQRYLEGPNDDPSRPLRVLPGFTIIDAGPGENAEARLTVPVSSFARFDEGLSQ